MAMRSSSSSSAMRTVKEVKVDAVVIGAGIIGLLCTRQLLNQGLKVALVERKELCAGATGAGQGYVWMAHRSPGTAGWDLASDSIMTWHDMLNKDVGLKRDCEWQETGSLLLATNPEEMESLVSRKEALASGGIESQILTAKQVMEMEPALHLPSESAAGLLVSSDAQINGRRTAGALLAQVKQSPNQGSYCGCRRMVRRDPQQQPEQ
jgi:glycine/D-amino acid oxidase-like deaminating enzyme